MYTSRARNFIRITVPALAAIFVLVASAIIQPIQSYASQNISDTVKADGKVRLIVKFDDIAAGKIAYKMQGKEQVIDNNLNEYILKKIDEKYNLTKLKKLFADKELARTEEGFAREFANYYIIEVDKDEKDTDKICAALQYLSDIDMIEPDLKVQISATPLPDVSYIPNDYYVTSDNTYWRQGAWSSSYPDLWGLQKIQAFEAWDLFTNAQADPGKNIVVAVIDTGVDFSHPDVGGNKWVNPDEVAGNGTDDDGNGYVDDINGWDFVNGDNDPYDGHGHGTHCSGTIAAVTNNSTGIAGIAPNAKIMAVKGLSDSGSGYISDLANCLIYAANNGADVLSNSWGGSGSSSTLENAVNYAYSQGCVVVAAAGNSNADASGYTPAGYANVITVAATDVNDVKASFSNYGSIVDISAPGVSVLSSTGGSYAAWSGTSMACPHVSGVAAVILSQDPTLTNAEVDQRIKDTADDIYSQNPSWTGRLGAGRVNVYKAILAGGPQKHAPVLAPIGNKSVNEGALLNFTVSATDEDGDPLIYSIVDLPGGLEKSGNANFFVQSDTVYEGTKALQSGAIAKNQSASVTKTANLSASGTISFYWKVSSAQNSGILAFYIDNAKQAEISGEVNWQSKTFNLSAGSHTLKWTYSKNNTSPAGTDAGWIDNIVIASGSSESYNFENGQMPSGFTTGGHGRFYVTSGTAHQGTYAMMADPSVVDNQYEYVTKTVQTVANTQLSFWWKVSSEYYYDFLEFYIDGVLQAEISGETSWQKKTYTLSAGSHTLKWQYWKDYSVTTGQDTGWVDDILIDGGSQEVINFEPVSGQANPLPRGASFDSATRRFSWTPDYSQAGSYSNIRFVVTEDTAEKRSDYEDITITVNNINMPPVLDPIGDKTVSEMAQLRFTISASDPEGDTLTYSAPNLPTGASFDANTHTFSWVPSYQQAGIYSGVRFEVTDSASGGGGGGVDTDVKLLLHLNADFADSSPSAHPVTKYGNASVDTSVKKFGAGSCLLSGTSGYLSSPDSDDWYFGTGDFTVDFWIRFTSTSGMQVMAGQYVDINNLWEVSRYADGTLRMLFRIGGVNKGYYRTLPAPTINTNTWYHIAFVRSGTRGLIFLNGILQSMNEITAFSTNDVGNLTGSMYIGRGENDPNYTVKGNIDELRISKGIARWTSDFTPPTSEYSEGEGGTGNIDYEEITITVLDVNLTPVLNPIGNKSVNEGSLLSFVIAGTDNDGDVLAYSAAHLPSGASFNTQTRTFSWTPSYTQAGTYSGVHFEVTDGKATDSEDITIVVNNTNRAPVLNSIGNKTVSENSLLEFKISASDPDGDALTYYATNLPSGASFNTSTQTFSWTPTYTQAGTYTNVSFAVSDGSAADAEAITITVNNTNRKPVISNLTVTPSLNIDEGENITIVINASDPDGDTLSYFVQNEPEGSGFVDNDFSWTPDYNQAGTYADITFTVSDGIFHSDPQSVTITVANINDAPVFISSPTRIASYGGYSEVKSLGAKGDYVYAAYADGRLKALDISNIKDIREVSAITGYRNLSRLEIFESEIYLIDSGTSASIVDITIPSSLYTLGSIPETAALDTATYENTAYIACGENLVLYDVSDKNYPQKLEGYDLGKADKLTTKDEHVYAISSDEDLKVIDAAINEVIAFKNFSGSSGYEPTDIAVSGNNVYIAKDAYGIVCFDVQSPESPSENGEFYIFGTAIKEIKTYNKDRIFALGDSSGTYRLIYIDSSDTTLMSGLWTYSFDGGAIINSIDADGNIVFVAYENSIDIIAPPLDDLYTVEAESELKITIYAEDPDGDTVSYTMGNKPDFAEAEFRDNGDGRATFTWTPTEEQIGTYADITFTADNGYQQISSKSIVINVVSKDTASQEPATLLLHLNQETGLSDSAPNNHTITTYGNPSIDTSIKKFGTGSCLFNGTNGYISSCDSNDWTFGAENFTVDFWVRFNDTSGMQVIIGQYVNINNVWEMSKYANGTLGILFRIGGANKGYYRTSSAPLLNTDTWYHLAFVRDGARGLIFINGVLQSVNEVTGFGTNDVGDLAGPLYVGSGELEPTYTVKGYLDEVRVSKGIARWTGNFTPPSSEY